MVREALKWKSKDAEAVDALHATAPELVAVYRQLLGQPDGVPGGRVHCVLCTARVDYCVCMWGCVEGGGSWGMKVSMLL